MKMSVQAYKDATERRHRLFAPINAVQDHPIEMKNGKPVLIIVKPQVIHTPLTPHFQVLAPHRHDRWRGAHQYQGPVRRSSVVPSIGRIKKVVAQHFGLTVWEIEGPSRFQQVVRARQICMYLARTMLKRSLPDVGHYIGGRDHTTAMHGARKIAELRAKEPLIDALLTSLWAKIDPYGMA
jgi:hypothetical protein